MEIKNVRVNEIHWSIGWNESQEANKRLKDKLGETSKYFAMLGVGNATYNWMVDTVGKWRAMGIAPDSLKAFIMEKAEEIRQEVFAKLPGDENLANKICQVPNYEEYIFYKENASGDPDVIITGWGFHNFKKAGPFEDHRWPPRPVKHTTTISFTIDGVRQPMRAFSIITPKMKKPNVTDEQGVKSFMEYAGTDITIIDEDTQRQFTFITEDKDMEMEFDITSKTSVVVEATLDGQPLSDAIAGIDYGGHHYDIPLNDGKATLNDLNFKSGESCVVTLRDEQRSQVLSGDVSNVISFNFTTPLPAEEKCTITVHATRDGQPLSGEIATIDYAGQHYELMLQENGTASVSDIDCTGGNCVVTLHGQEQTIVPVKDEDNIVNFDFQTETTQATVTVVNAQGQPMQGVHLRLEQENGGQEPTVFEAVLDEQGKATFVKDQYSIGQPLKAILTPNGQPSLEPIEFTLEAEENEYLLQQNAPQKGSRLMEIIVALLMLAALAALVIYALKPAITELTKLINKNIF